jgi:serine protease Do
VIGIDTAIRGDAQNIGFAIAVNHLRDLIPQLMKSSQVNKVDVGLNIHEVRTIHPPADIDVHLIADNHPGTITAIAGDKPRDIIDAYAILLRQTVGKSFSVQFDDGQTVQIEPKAVPLPDAVVQAREKLGITLETLTPMLAQKYGLDEDEGLLAMTVTRDGIAGRAGLQAGDLIVQLGRYRVSTPDDLSAVLDDFEKHPSPSRRLRIVIRRGQQIALGMLQL